MSMYDFSKREYGTGSFPRLISKVSRRLQVVTIAVLLIIITAPLGALGIGLTANLLLEKENEIVKVSPENYDIDELNKEILVEETPMIENHTV